MQNSLDAAPWTEAGSTAQIADWEVGCDLEVHFERFELEAFPDDESTRLEEYILQ